MQIVAMAREPFYRRQVGALAFRSAAFGDPEMLLLTSRKTERFVIPKGWPVKGLSDAEAVAKEAYEEAGVIGKVGDTRIGSYAYQKRLQGSLVRLTVDVYALNVKAQLPDWPERGKRASAWLAPNHAAQLVDEPELMRLIRDFGAGRAWSRRSAA
jgi:8-oxo-dGTP pyrophosphatase MutT (NUDIX family)